MEHMIHDGLTWEPSEEKLESLYYIEISFGFCDPDILDTKDEDIRLKKVGWMIEHGWIPNGVYVRGLGMVHSFWRAPKSLCKEKKLRRGRAFQNTGTVQLAETEASYHYIESLNEQDKKSE